MKLLEFELTAAAERTVSAGETNTAGAYAEYLKGRGYLARYEVTGNIDLALASFQSATQQDPHYAAAYAGLAEAYWWKARLTSDKHWADRALENAQRAVQLNPKMVAGHVKLG